MTRSVLSIGLMICLTVVVAGCSPSATPTAAPPTIVPTAATAAATRAPTQPPLTSTDAPAPVPTVTPTPRASETQSLVVVTVECEAGQPWLRTHEELILALCFNPHPPQLGAPVTFEAFLTDAAGQPIVDATVELALIGGMAGMVGEHDEEFVVELVGQEPGQYTALATVGPRDLVLSGVSVKIRSGRQIWSFSISADELQP